MLNCGYGHGYSVRDVLAAVEKANGSPLVIREEDRRAGDPPELVAVAERIRKVREQSRMLVTIGACATAGGVQALRNFQGVAAFMSIVYARPEYISTLASSTAIADHVPVDLELRGCPVSKHQLLELINAWLNGRRPNLASHSVCVECKLRGTVCVMVAQGSACLGPVTQAGCGAICPACGRGCYGCFGPQDTANTDSLGEAWLRAGESRAALARVFHSFNAAAEPFASAGRKYGQDDNG